MRSTLLMAVLLAGLWLEPGVAEAMQTDGSDTTAARQSSTPSSLEEGDRLHALLRPRDALQAYERVLESDSSNFEALWKASRSAVNVGMLAREDRKEWFLEAEAYARRAVAERPGAVEGHHWLAVALGRRALEEGMRTRVKLAAAILDEARIALQADSLHAGAHHVLGQWHAEIRRLSGIERFVASRILGGDAMHDASWEQALQHMEKAVELSPHGLIHRLELARIYRDLDDPDRAREQLREVLERPAVEPTDPLHKQEAQELLQKIG